MLTLSYVRRLGSTASWTSNLGDVGANVVVMKTGVDLKSALAPSIRKAESTWQVANTTIMENTRLPLPIFEKEGMIGCSI